jgi:hypothetical protein
MDFQFAIVFDVAQFAEFIHEMTDARSGCPDRLREGLPSQTPSDALRGCGILGKLEMPSQ